MNHYDYSKFIYPVPLWYVIPKGTQVRCQDTDVYPRETFFTTVDDLPVHPHDGKWYNLDYDITLPQVPTQQLPTDPLSVIYNVTLTDRVDLFPVGMLTVHGVWTLVNEEGEFYYGDAKEIRSFDTTPPQEEEEER